MKPRLNKINCIVCKKGPISDGVKKRSMHRFPINQTHFDAWILNSGLHQHRLEQHHRLCSDHFGKECIVQQKNGRSKLLLGSVPTLFFSFKCCFCDMPNSPEEHRILYKFPPSQSTRFRKWVAAIPANTTSFSENDRICSDHFEARCFIKTERGSKLKYWSVPTKFNIIKSTCDNAMEIDKDVTINPNHTAVTQKELRLSEPDMYASDTTESETETGKCNADDEWRNIIKLIGSQEGARTCNVNRIDDVVPDTYASDTTESEAETETPKDFEVYERRNGTRTTDVVHNILLPEIEFISCPSLESTDYILPKTAHIVNFKRNSNRETFNRCHSHPFNTGVALSSFYHDHNYYSTAETMQKHLSTSLQRSQKLARVSKFNRRRIKRLENKVASLKAIVRELQTKLSKKESHEKHVLQENCEISQFLRRHRNSQRNAIEGPIKKYPLAVRTFALTLYNHSPQAYKYVREQFRNALPDTNTLRLWDKLIVCEPEETAAEENLVSFEETFDGFDDLQELFYFNL